MKKTLHDELKEIMIKLTNSEYDAYISKDKDYAYGYIILTDITVQTATNKMGGSILLVEDKKEDMLIHIELNKLTGLDISYSYLPNKIGGTSCSFKRTYDLRSINTIDDLIHYTKVDRAYATRLGIADSYLLTTKESIMKHLNNKNPLPWSQMEKLDKIN